MTNRVYEHPTPVQIGDYNCRLYISYYDTNPERRAIFCNDWETTEPLFRCSVNLPQFQVSSDEVILNSNLTGLICTSLPAALVEAGIVADEAIMILPSDSMFYPVHKLLVGV